MSALYSEIILDHYRHPRRAGLRPGDVEVHHVNPTCGDEVRLRVRIDGDLVADVSYAGEGCSISQASTSMMTELLVGRSVADALSMSEHFLAMVAGRSAAEDEIDVLDDAVALAGVARYPARVKCALLGWMAWKDATAQAVASGGATSRTTTAPTTTARTTTAPTTTAQTTTAQTTTAETKELG